MKKLNVAIIGYGKSGGGIHGGFFKSKNNDIVNVVAVAELDPERAKVAKADYNCDTYSDYRELFQSEIRDRSLYRVTPDRQLEAVGSLSEAADPPPASSTPARSAGNRP